MLDAGYFEDSGSEHFEELENARTVILRIAIALLMTQLCNWWRELKDFSHSTDDDGWLLLLD